MFPVEKGTYLLLLKTTGSGRLQAGPRVELQLRPGWYGYVGSAFGPGGLNARLAHHLKPIERPRWHIDYLRRHARPAEIWFAVQDRMVEHRWAALLAEWSLTTDPSPGFGASDCDCRSHLVHFVRLPSCRSMRLRLRKGLARTTLLHHEILEPVERIE